MPEFLKVSLYLLQGQNQILIFKGTLLRNKLDSNNLLIPLLSTFLSTIWRYIVELDYNIFVDSVNLSIFYKVDKMVKDDTFDMSLCLSSAE